MKIAFITPGVISFYFWAFDIVNIYHLIAGLWRYLIPMTPYILLLSLFSQSA